MKSHSNYPHYDIILLDPARYQKRIYHQLHIAVVVFSVLARSEDLFNHVPPIPLLDGIIILNAELPSLLLADIGQSILYSPKVTRIWVAPVSV